jgi:membrane dipeptidase
MQRGFIVDAHEDIAYNVTLGRDFKRAALETRALEDPPIPKRGVCTVGLPDLLKANVRIVFATIWAAPCGVEDIETGPCYQTADEAHVQAKRQLEYYNELAQDPRILLIRRRGDVDRVLEAQKPTLGLVILMEGADPIITPKQTQEWFEAGVRIIGPGWQRTRYAGGTKAPGPLTEIGRELMSEMERIGIILDTSHLAEASFHEALDLFHGNVIASHANSRLYVPTDRQLSDEMISALVSRDGVIGTVLYNAFLQADWKETGRVKRKVTLLDVVKHIKHVCDLAGDAAHAGLGSDLDGGFGAESIPAEMDTVADLPKIENALTVAGLSNQDADNIMSQNWTGFLKRSLPP